MLGLPRSWASRSRRPRALRSARSRPTWRSSAPRSLLKDVKPLSWPSLGRRIHVITTCEELAYPDAGAPRRVPRARPAGRAKKVSVLATGRQPRLRDGRLALVLTAPCASVRRVSVTRVVDAGARKLPLQRKVGAGLNLGQFRRAVTEGTVRHVGPRRVGPHDRGGARAGSSTGSTRRSSRRSRRATSTPSTCASPAGAAAGIKQAVAGLPRRRPRREPRPADVRGGGVAARPHPGRRRPAGRRDDRRRRGRRGGDGGRRSSTRCRALLAAPAGPAERADLPLVHALNPQELASLPAAQAVSGATPRAGAA